MKGILMLAKIIKSQAHVCCLVLTCGLITLPAATAFSDETSLASKPLLAASLPRKLAYDPHYTTKKSLPSDWESHPLAPTLNLARERIAHIEAHVRDFTCVLIKRERLNGKLRDYEYIATKVRREQQVDGEVTTPFAVYAEFLGPVKLRGRKVLYIKGENDGKMLVRNGGKRFNYINVKVDPTSPAALRESRYPITDLNLDAVTERLIEQTLSDIRNDPEGKNSEVKFYEQASVDDRPCLHIQVIHPTRQEEFSYHKANIYIDNELHMPIRIETYDWPEEGEDEEILQEEFTFTRLKLNVGLRAADFSESVLERK